MLRIAYFVSRTTRKPGRRTKLETKNGVLRVKGAWGDDATHNKIRSRIVQRNPGWQVGGYTPRRTITPILDAKGHPLTIV